MKNLCPYFTALLCLICFNAFAQDEEQIAKSKRYSDFQNEAKKLQENQEDLYSHYWLTSEEIAKIPEPGGYRVAKTANPLPICRKHHLKDCGQCTSAYQYAESKQKEELDAKLNSLLKKYEISESLAELREQERKKELKAKEDEKLKLIYNKYHNKGIQPWNNTSKGYVVSYQGHEWQIADEDFPEKMNCRQAQAAVKALGNGWMIPPVYNDFSIFTLARNKYYLKGLGSFKKDCPYWNHYAVDPKDEKWEIPDGNYSFDSNWGGYSSWDATLYVQVIRKIK